MKPIFSVIPLMALVGFAAYYAFYHFSTWKAAVALAFMGLLVIGVSVDLMKGKPMRTEEH